MLVYDPVKVIILKANHNPILTTTKTHHIKKHSRRQANAHNAEYTRQQLGSGLCYIIRTRQRCSQCLPHQV